MIQKRLRKGWIVVKRESWPGQPGFPSCLLGPGKPAPGRWPVDGLEGAQAVGPADAGGGRSREEQQGWASNWQDDRRC